MHTELYKAGGMFYALNPKSPNNPYQILENIKSFPQLIEQKNIGKIAKREQKNKVVVPLV